MKALWLILRLHFMTWLPMLTDALAFIKRNLFPILFVILIGLVLLLSWRLDNAQQALNEAKAAHAAELQAIDLAQAIADAQATESARITDRNNKERINDATNKAALFEKEIVETRLENDALVTSLRDTNRLLRQDNQSIRADLSRLSRQALDDYASTATELFADLAERTRQLGSVSTGISTNADTHANEAQQLDKSWPENAP